jgi:hypothetical protein
MVYKYGARRLNGTERHGSQIPKNIVFSGLYAGRRFIRGESVELPPKPPYLEGFVAAIDIRTMTWKQIPLMPTWMLR